MRKFFLLLPERIKLLCRLLGEHLDSALLALVDRYLARREAAYQTPAFEDLPVLYDEADFPILRSDPPEEFVEIPE